jgi:hypothetical protein
VTPEKRNETVTPEKSNETVTPEKNYVFRNLLLSNTIRSDLPESI